MDEDEVIGANLRRYRTDRGITQAKFAMALMSNGVDGMYPQTIQKIERGQRPLRFFEGLVAARVLDVKPEALYDLDPEADVDRDAAKLARDITYAAEAYAAAWDGLNDICNEAEEFLRDVSGLNAASRRWIENALNEARPSRKPDSADVGPSDPDPEPPAPKEN
jgi:transcriptional regulator with XRE-family HTH domain